MGSILVLEAKGAVRDKDKARRGGVELLSAPAATRLHDEKACILPLSNVYAVHFAGPSGRLVDVICSPASLEAPLCVLSCCSVSKEPASFTGRTLLVVIFGVCVSVYLCVKRVGIGVGGGSWSKGHQAASSPSL